MARCFCRWRRVFICLCTPCICLALAFAYVFLSLCMAMNANETGGQLNTLQQKHFVAFGSLRNKTFAPLPKTFWDLNPHRNAFWNHLQLTIDRHFNPILRPKNAKTGFENSDTHESLLKQIFSEVTDSRQRDYDKLPNEIQDFVRHMQRKNYPTLIQPDGVCGAGSKDEKGPPFLLLAIKSTELNFKNRQAIRQTWGQVGWVAGQERSSTGENKGGGYIRRVFLLAKEDSEELGVDASELLRLESKHYGDILQWDFKDTFFNLTLKDVHFWRWYSQLCSPAQFIFKGDDDVFVNTPKLITYLQEQLEKRQADKTIEDFMVGDVIGAALPSRDRKSKYFIPDTFYKGFYPSYAGGGGVVYSGLLAERLYTISKRVYLYPIDDVFVGMCMLRLNAQPIHHPAFLTFDFPGKEEDEQCSYHKILLVHKRSPSQLTKLWSDMKRTKQQCWDVPLRVEAKKETKL